MSTASSVFWIGAITGWLLRRRHRLELRPCVVALRVGAHLVILHFASPDQAQALRKGELQLQRMTSVLAHSQAAATAMEARLQRTDVLIPKLDERRYAVWMALHSKYSNFQPEQGVLIEQRMRLI